jgi:hypothetical protein
MKKRREEKNQKNSLPLFSFLNFNEKKKRREKSKKFLFSSFFFLLG